jgi:long-chain acyl-CoA synthetase
MERGVESPRRYAEGPRVDIPEGNVAELFLEAVDAYGKSDALKYKRGGAWYSISHRKVYEDVKRLTLGLESLGIGPGDRVAILSENRPEWLLTDFACVMARAVSVPLYPVLPPEQITYMLAHSEAKVLLVSTAEQLAKLENTATVLPALKHVVVYEPGDAEGRVGGVLSLAELLERGDVKIGELSDEEYRARALATDPHELLTIIYTSGTTGRPKGAMLTHNNLVSNVRAVLHLFHIGPQDTSLSVLPLCHVFERMAGHYVMFSAGVTIAYAESFATVAENFLEVRPTVMTLVPRGYEKIHARVEEKARQAGPLAQKVLRWSVAVGVRRLERLEAGRKLGPWLSVRYRLADRLVFAKLRREVGGRMKFFVSGGAPLNPDLGRFFLAAGLPILEGYGLTETSPVISFNTPDDIKVGTVGKPIPGVEVAIADDGEILTRGPHVMKGYYKDPEETAAVFDAEGWFHTGDIGALDEDGRLSITDRKKELIVTAGGKNIAPQPIENRAKGNPYVSQAVMVGDRRRYPIMLVVPEFDALERWARSEGIVLADRGQLVRDPRVAEFIEREVLSSLSNLARFEQPKKVALLAEELSIEGGELTPTLKVKRRVVEKKYKELIDSLYRED